MNNEDQYPFASMFELVLFEPWCLQDQVAKSHMNTELPWLHANTGSYLEQINTPTSRLKKSPHCSTICEDAHLFPEA